MEERKIRTLTGFAKPDETLDLIFYATSNNDDRTKINLDYRLIEEASQTLVANRVETQIGPPYYGWWHLQLPDHAPAKYLFGVTATDENGTLVAALISEIKVPRQEIMADLRVEGGEVTTQDSIRLLVTNTGETTIGFGYEYHIEKHVNGTWWRIPNGLIAWLAVLYTMGPGGSGSSGMINVKGLDSGSYRISKEFQAEGVNGRKMLFAEFTVSRPPEENLASLPRWGFDFSYALAEQSMESPDYPRLWLSNDGARSLLISSSYRLEKLVSGVWESFYVSDSDGERSVVRWGEVYSQTFNESKLSVGEYRLFKDIGVEGTSAIKQLVLEFSYTKP
ncbi:MAG: hypothetical protein Q8O47_06860 [Candidatus Bathyarchaeota archaeon]|nr:hypothetical protein [Candidatus Bathyarchaeota archaeon]